MYALIGLTWIVCGVFVSIKWFNKAEKKMIRYGSAMRRLIFSIWDWWSYVKKKYKLNVTNFLCSERSLTCYFYCILLDVFKILLLIFIWRQISTMTVNAHGIVKCFDVFKNQFMCMCIIKDFKPVDPFSLQKCMERFDTGVIPWICFL